MTHATMPSQVAQRIFDLLDANRVALYGADAMVFYGDQDKIPVSPTICVEAGPMDRVLASAMGPKGRTENNFTVYIIIYYASVKSNQLTKLEAEVISEATANFLDNNPQLVLAGEEMVIHGFTRVVDHGYARRNSTLMYGSRLTWAGKTKMQLGV